MTEDDGWLGGVVAGDEVAVAAAHAGSTDPHDEISPPGLGFINVNKACHIESFKLYSLHEAASSP